MATYMKRGSTWQARVSKDKHRFNKSGFATKRDAIIWASKIELGEENKPKNNILFSDYFKKWYETYKTNRTDVTLLQYKNTDYVIDKYLKGETLNNLTRAKLQQFINEYGKNHAKETVQKHKGHIIACLKDAYHEGLIKQDVTYRLNLVYNQKTIKPIEEKFLEAEDARKLVDYCEKNITRGNFCILTGILSGARFGEVRALIDSDIDTKNHTISINKAVDRLTGKDKETKNKQSTRIITMPDRWFQIYKNYKHDGKRLFDISSNAVNKDMRYIAKKIDIKPVTYHALRHTHASILLANNVSMQYVSERLGHANLSITEKVYSHLLENKRKEEDKKAMDIF